MIYINALELVNMAIKNDLLKVKEGKVFVYKAKTTQNKEGWYLEDKNTIAQELMRSESGQSTIIEALKEKGLLFVPTDYSFLTKSNNFEEN